MAILQFDKKELGNLEYSLQREFLSTNRAGGYMNTTITCCNTRKYHGLMICPVDTFGDQNFVLLSSLDDTVIQHDQAFNLALHRFPGTYEPRGHKYIVDFKYTPTPTITYRVGGVILQKEMLWIHKAQQLLIRYTLLEANSPTKLRLRPFLAFRNIHALSKVNMDADVLSYKIKGGVKSRMYEGFPWLNMQVSQRAEFVAAPNWYNDFEYFADRDRGYLHSEDLLTTGYFEMSIKKDKSIIFSASTSEVDTKQLEEMFNEEIARRTNKTEFLPCLTHSARQFIVKKDKKTEIVAGYPWFGSRFRDALIALPGIMLTQGNVNGCKDVLGTIIAQAKDGVLPNTPGNYNTADTSLWLFHTLQELEKHVGECDIWKEYGHVMKLVLNAYIVGVHPYVKMHENGLIWASMPGRAMTWMDAVIDGNPVTGRDGYQIEVNALWYNAVCYTLALAEKHDDKKFVKEWTPIRKLIKINFDKTFSLPEDRYMADFANEWQVNKFIRPNQVIACSLPYSPINDEQKKDILKTIETHLLTPQGLRTLSPRNPLYKGRYEGNPQQRDLAYHEGSVWVWPLEHYVKAKFKLYGKQYLAEAAELLEGFHVDITSYGIGSIAEVYDGDPPHNPKGAISQAWSVGAVLMINSMVEEYSKK